MWVITGPLEERVGRGGRNVGISPPRLSAVKRVAFSPRRFAGGERERPGGGARCARRKAFFSLLVALSATAFTLNSSKNNTL